jgi:hypothetical protein
MKADMAIYRRLRLHNDVMTELEREGYMHEIASREALRRLQDKSWRFTHWEDYFTAVEREGYSLKHG